MRIGSAFCAALLFLACGVAADSAFRRAPQTTKPAATATPTIIEQEQTANASPWWENPKLEAWENLHNGKQLPLDYGSPSVLDENIRDAKLVFLPSGNSLVAFVNNLYMLDADGRVVWKHAESWRIFDFAYVESTGLVYGTASGNTMFILDASTGGRLAHYSGDGKPSYEAAIPYGANQCLITENFAGPRDGFDGGVPVKDGVSAWRGTKMQWRVEIPPDAEIQVSGPRIFAVTKTRTNILIKEIEVPKDEG